MPSGPNKPKSKGLKFKPQKHSNYFKSVSYTQLKLKILYILYTAVIQVKQSNSNCRVWPLLPYSNRVGLDKKLSNNPERVSINFGTWPISNEALIAYHLISKQHFNHANTRVQFDLTIRIVNTREGGGCLDLGLVEVSGLGRTSKIIEIKISSLQVFSYQQLLHARFFSNVSMWVYPAVHAQTWETTTVCTKTDPWREFILSLVFFTVYVLSRFPFKPALSGQIKQVFSLQVPTLIL